MLVREIMVKHVVTAAGEETVASAAKKMRDANVGCLVVANAGTVRGILTDRDLAIRCLSDGHDARQCLVARHMSSPVTTAPSSLDVLEAAHLMVEKRVKRLPVVEEGKLVGLVSFSDVAQALERPVHDLLVGMGAGRRAA